MIRAVIVGIAGSYAFTMLVAQFWFGPLPASYLAVVLGAGGVAGLAALSVAIEDWTLRWGRSVRWSRSGAVVSGRGRRRKASSGTAGASSGGWAK